MNTFVYTHSTRSDNGTDVLRILSAKCRLLRGMFSVEYFKMTKENRNFCEITNPSPIKLSDSANVLTEERHSSVITSYCCDG